ncbi:MAG: hypothetical protein ACXVB9_06025 [Bdellovibrionota bacterium]
MFKILSLTALGTLTALTALAASVSGNWTGAGTMNMTGAPAMPCDNVTLDLADSGSRLEIRQYKFSCSGEEENISPMSFDLRNGSYFIGNDKVGERQGDRITLTMVDSQNHITMSNVFDVAGGKLQLAYKMSGPGFEESMNTTLHQ